MAKPILYRWVQVSRSLPKILYLIYPNERAELVKYFTSSNWLPHKINFSTNNQSWKNYSDIFEAYLFSKMFQMTKALTHQLQILHQADLRPLQR